MQKILLPFFLLITVFSFGQQTIGIIIPKDDASPFPWQTKHMWVGMQNPISSNYNGDYEFLKIWTDNGTLDTGNFYLCKYALVPGKAGIVNVYSTQKIWKGKKYDTVATVNTFQAIVPPKIAIKLIHDNFLKDSTISFKLIDSVTLKPISKRYQIGGFYDAVIYDNEDNKIGALIMCSGTKINVNDTIHNTNNINYKKGYKVKFAITLRDMKTDLLISTNELVYTFK